MIKKTIETLLKIIRPSTWELDIFRCRDCGRWVGLWEIYEGKCAGHKMMRTDNVAPWELKEIKASYRKKLISDWKQIFGKKNANDSGKHGKEK